MSSRGHSVPESGHRARTFDLVKLVKLHEFSLCIKRKTKAAIPTAMRLVFLVSECACAASFDRLLRSEKCRFWVLHPFGTHSASIQYLFKDDNGIYMPSTPERPG